MTEKNVVRFRDYDRRSRQPDAVDRDPGESAVIIILPDAHDWRQATPREQARLRRGLECRR
jgi:hypothetical protein